MKRTNQHFINDIQNSIQKIEIYIQDMEYEELVENDLVKDAVIRNLEIIGEVAKNIDENIRKQYEDIPWRKIIGLRNILSHAYFGIDWENIWKIIKDDIPQFKNEFENIDMD